MKKFAITTLCLVSLFVASCGKGESKTASNTTPAPTPTADEFLKKSADAMLATKSAKFGLKRLGKPAIFNEAMKLTFTKATCEYKAPDRAHATIQVGLANGNQMQLERIWVPEGIYQTNPVTKQYVKAPSDVTFNVVVLFQADGIPKVLRSGIQKAQIVGHEKLEDEDAVHFKGEADGKMVAPLLADMIPADKFYPIDIYTDPKTYYPRRLTMDVGDGDAFEIDLFGVDQPVDVKSPAAAAQPPAGAPAK